MQVAVEDQYGNTVTTDNSNVTLALNQPAGTSFISGASYSAGVATITTSTNNNLAANDVVIVTGVTSSASSAYNSYNGTYVVIGATATTFTYALSTNPGSYTGGGLAGLGNGGGGSLKGTLTEQATSGVAAFPGLSISQVVSGTTYGAAGAGYTLTAGTASDGGLTSLPSAAFNTTLFVTGLTMTPTGFVATFSQPFDPTQVNLYGAQSTNSLPSNVILSSGGKVVRGSLVIDPSDAKITFVATTMVANTGLPIHNISISGATSGVLPAGTYNLTLLSGSTDFTTTTGQVLDGNNSGAGGSNYTSNQAVSNSAVAVIVPSFARGPGNTVNVTNASAPIATTATTNIASGTSGATGSHNVTGATWTSGTHIAKITVSTTSGLSVGSSVTVAGVTPTGYNGTFTVTAVSSTTFSYSLSTNPGTYTSGGTAAWGLITITTTTAHNLQVDQQVVIGGVGVTGYNGTFTVLSTPTATTFTYNDTSYSGITASGGGTVTLYGISESGTTVTVNTTVSNGLTANEPVTISGASASAYNSNWVVVSAAGASFTFTAASGQGVSSGGTYTDSRGIPISLMAGTSTGGVTSGQFTLTFDPTLLTVTGVTVDPNLAATNGATLTLDGSSNLAAGLAVIDFSATAVTANSTGIVLGGLTATVPSAALYKSKDLLHFSSVSLNNGAIAAVGADAVQVVAFLGDASGDGYITSADAVDVENVAGGSDAGFAAYRLADPYIIGDLSGDGKADGATYSLLTKYINSTVTPQMPAWPGVPSNFAAGPDPAVSIPSALQVGADGRVTVPVTHRRPAAGGQQGHDGGHAGLELRPGGLQRLDERHPTGQRARLRQRLEVAIGRGPGDGPDRRNDLEPHADWQFRGGQPGDDRLPPPQRPCGCGDDGHRSGEFGRSERHRDRHPGRRRPGPLHADACADRRLQSADRRAGELGGCHWLCRCPGCRRPCLAGDRGGCRPGGAGECGGCGKRHGSGFCGWRLVASKRRRRAQPTCRSSWPTVCLRPWPAARWTRPSWRAWAAARSRPWVRRWPRR